MTSLISPAERRAALWCDPRWRERWLERERRREGRKATTTATKPAKPEPTIAPEPPPEARPKQANPGDRLSCRRGCVPRGMTGFRYVTYNRKRTDGRPRFRAMPTGKRGETVYLSTHDTAEEAARAVDRWLVKQGRPALNFPAEWANGAEPEPEPHDPGIRCPGVSRFSYVHASRRRRNKTEIAWEFRIACKDGRHHTETHPTAEDAARAADRWLVAHGRKALNFPGEWPNQEPDHATSTPAPTAS